VLSFGQDVKVMVIKFNEETKRISLGMKQLDANPWENITEEFPIGKVMSGKITNIADYGVFIELKDGIEGLVHSSEIAWGKSSQNPKKLLNIGQEVEFVILDVDTERHRISLSIKKCQNNPLVKFAEQNPVGSIIKVPIRNITDFGMFVALDENTDGMIHESDISWENDGVELLKNYNKGDEVECKVLNIDIEKDRVALGIKQLTEEPDQAVVVETYKKNMIVTCVVTSTNNDGVEVSVDDNVTGFIKKIELSAERSEQKPDRFAQGDRIDAKIIAIEKNGGRLNLSIKALEIDERDKAIKEYGSTDSGASLGDILGAALGEKEGKK
jgi:small subunit ribosomal protein S1